MSIITRRLPSGELVEHSRNVRVLKGDQHQHLAGLSPEATARITNSACWKLATTPRPGPVPALSKEK